MVRDVEAIPFEELGGLVQLDLWDKNMSCRRLLFTAAYFVVTAMNYSGRSSKERAIERYTHFLSPTLLREFAGDRFHPID